MSQTKCLNCMQDYDSSESVICPHCGYDQNAEKKKEYYLDPGYMLNDRYIIGTVIGSGGFGITYIAWDTVLEKKLAIKEYFPTKICTRVHGENDICTYDTSSREWLEEGLNSFIDEALRLAKLNTLPNIVHIYDSFPANQTAYIVMDYVDGKTLMEILKERGPLPYEQVVEYMLPVLSVLDRVHKENIIHRDIAPDNIKVNSNGDIVLLDFGSARKPTAYNSKSLSVFVKRGYSPWEQSLSNGNQGPWTDMYSVGAVMYHLITGKLPDDVSDRITNDELKTPTQLGFNIPENIENAIMNALNLRYEYRIQSANEFAKALRNDTKVNRVNAPKKGKSDSKSSKRTILLIVIAAIVAIAAILVIFAGKTNLSNSATTQQSTEIFSDYTNEDFDKSISEIEEVAKKYGIEIEYNYIIDPNMNVNTSKTITKVTVIPEDVSDLTEIEVISIVITMPPIVMPDLKGSTKSEAIEKLTALGLKEENIGFIKKKNNDEPDKTVFKQSVKQGELIVDLDAKIKLTIAENYTETTTTTTRKSSQNGGYNGGGNNGENAEDDDDIEEFNPGAYPIPDTQSDFVDDSEHGEPPVDVE